MFVDLRALLGGAVQVARELELDNELAELHAVEHAALVGIIQVEHLANRQVLANLGLHGNGLDGRATGYLLHARLTQLRRAFGAQPPDALRTRVRGHAGVRRLAKMHLTRRHLAALGRPGVHHDLHNLVELEPLVRRHLRQRVEEVVVRELALALELGLGENQIDGDVGEFRIQQPGAGDELRKRRAVHLLQSHLPLPVGAVLDEQLLERLVRLVLRVHLGFSFRSPTLSGFLDVQVENRKLVKAHDAVAVGVHLAEVLLDDVLNLVVFQPLEHLQARQEGGDFVRLELLLSVGAALVKEFANEHLVTGRLDHALGHRHLTNRVDRILQLPALHVALRCRLLHQRGLGVLRLLGQTDARFRGRRIRVVFFVVGILEIVVTGVTGIGLGLGRVGVGVAGVRGRLRLVAGLAPAALAGAAAVGTLVASAGAVRAVARATVAFAGLAAIGVAGTAAAALGADDLALELARRAGLAGTAGALSTAGGAGLVGLPGGLGRRGLSRSLRGGASGGLGPILVVEESEHVRAGESHGSRFERSVRGASGALDVT
mmetsp:Transcript_11254/g.48037  ORF Transcript_11254/g.48037 Transcript_11254/m.48037 type:complete len:546 (+) Transcript_11254:525-2162(+)